MALVELKRDLLTNKYTRVFHEDKDSWKYNAPHHFIVTRNNPNSYTCDQYSMYVGDQLCAIDFQEGPIKECGVNGVCNEDLINMVIVRLICFQNSKFRCKENDMAITKLEEALLWLRKRTMSRESRGVEGTHEV